MAFDNNPVFFVDPLGLAAEGGGEGEPVKEGGEEKIYNQGSTEEVQIIANKNPKTAQLQENVLMSKGKYADSKYDSYRMSRNAYLRSLSLKQNNPNYDGNDHLSNYKKYGWIKFDPSASFEESDGQWRRNSDKVIMEGKDKSLERFEYFAGGLALAGGIYVAVPVLLSGSTAWGIASNLTIKSVGLKMGFSALLQGIINEGRINVIGVLGDGILGYGSSSIIGSGLEYNFNVLTLNNEFNYLGNGIDGQ